MNKVIRDGKVAVVVSPGFGAGWSTWATARGGEDGEDVTGFMLFDPTLVDMVERGALAEEIETYVTSMYSDVYCGGADDLTIQWLPVGTAFRIHEYDGSESVEIRDDIQWTIA
jgi:hypothetical protein